MEILIVDDSKMLRYMTRDVLRSLGYERYHEASHVDEARLRMGQHKIDLVISDFHMPKETGLDLLKWIRATPEYASTPVILLTTDGEKKTIISIVQAGVQAYLLKPVHKDSLGQKMAELSAKYGFPAPNLS
jgi:two-component system, chemotaxis family, chemotaxis protein CheY